MKNKLKIFLCVVMILVFSFGTCSTAYAKTDFVPSLSICTQIVKDYYCFSATDYNFPKPNYNVIPCFTYSYNGGLYMLWISPHAVKNDSLNFTTAYGSSGISSGGGSSDFVVFKFDSDNLYSKPSIVASDNDTVYGIGTGIGLSEEHLLTNTIDSYYNIVGLNGDLVFQKGTSQSPNPNPETPPLTPGSNTLSTMFNKNSAMLNGVFQEIVALLPLLLPVLITFLAIRKGIKFTLQTLRSI